MKKNMCLLLVLVLMVSFVYSGTVFAQQDKEFKVTEKQAAKLKKWGMSEKELAELTQEKLVKFMRELSAVPGPQKSSGAVEYTQKEVDYYNQLLQKKNLTSKQMELLGNLGYTYNQISLMSKNELDKIISKYSDATGELGIMATTYTAYTKPIPYHGSSPGETTYFESSVYVSDDAIMGYCEDAMNVAEWVFSKAYNYASSQSTQNIRFSYFLFGEKSPGIHEGLDVQDQQETHRAISSATPGNVVGTPGGAYGIVKVYDPVLSETIVYMHMVNIPTALLNGTDKDITLNERLGYQGDAGLNDGRYHLHLQALDGYWTGTVPLGDNYTLVSRIPYWYLNYHI